MLLGLPCDEDTGVCTPGIYYHELNFIVELVSIITFFVVAGILFIRKENEIESARKIKVGYALFAIFYALCRIFFIVAVWFHSELWIASDRSDPSNLMIFGYIANGVPINSFVVAGYVISCIGLVFMAIVVEKYSSSKARHVFTIVAILLIVYVIGWYPDPNPDFPELVRDSYNFFVVMGYFFACFGLTCMILALESYLITRTHHIISIFGLVMTLLNFLAVLGLLSQNMALLLSYLSSPALTAMIAILYVYLAAKGTAELRRKAIMILIAILFIGVASIIDGESLIISASTWFSNDFFLDLYYCVAPALLIIGIFLFLKNTY
ncbi:MAG: hypothetical protein Q6373_014530 [Candidatus Sigynarchaeota archaeon]